MAGYTIYNEEQFFKTFQTRRNRNESPNNAIEGPALWMLIDEVKNKHILDLGCGDGQFGLDLLSKGAASYHGLDGSERMINEATSHLKGKQASLDVCDLTDLKLQEHQYDIVVSRLVFHYLPDLGHLFNTVSQSLKSGGQFVFSVQHPVVTASMKSAKGSQRTDWIVDDYFQQGKRVEPWMNQQVTKYHRTTEQYVQELLQIGFKLEGLKEGEPHSNQFSTMEEYERRKRIPLVLILSARKH
ncbi:class I SAM-dependent methyltransferase [Pseudalkalibacillus berkeleyi]|uniref:Class I SAM-dependent methyltransferase n=1 Tax=Pseudalkalibacillus berkeleyi TaxID=1069813 RepID=A0ABS9GY63_9BACL|nr:class I SAM-dependent methyltransferase [Pseudalkalibacillus berkeleyi]MCF6136691.1 class I SAM-dependent methyltransferase [Pseudalkalibacillus berkeleyi]